MPNVVDLGGTPEFQGNDSMTAISELFNANLAPALTWLDSTLAGAEIVQFDTFGALRRLSDNPGDYRLTNTADACTANYAAYAPHQDTWLFWDGVHPTTRVHDILASMMVNAVPEPATLLLFVSGLLGVRACRWRPCSRGA